MKRFSCFLFIMSLAALFCCGEVFCDKILHRGNYSEPQSLDAHKTAGLYEANIIGDMFVGLVSLSANGQIIPGVAKSWDIDSTGTEYTFYLRESKWSNGDNVTAHDFVYSLRRLADPLTASPMAFLSEGIKNFNYILSGEEKDISKLGVYAVDDYVLKIELEKPAPYFLQILAAEQFIPMHASTLESLGNSWTKPENIVCNGPFILKQWDVNEKIILEKNNLFFDVDSVSLDGVVFYPINDEVEWRKYQSGDLDVTLGIPTEQLEWAKENLYEEIVIDNALSMSKLVFNMDKFCNDDDIFLRKAISFAINRDVLAKKILQEGNALYHIAPNGIAGYTLPTFDIELMSQNEREEMARKFMQEVGRDPKSINLEILYPLSEISRKLMAAVAGMLKQVLGINVSLRGEEWKVYLAQEYNQNFTITLSNWVADFNDVKNFFYCFRSSSETNFGKYFSSDFEDLMNQADNERDYDARSKLFEEAERVVVEKDEAGVPLYQRSRYRLVKPTVKGWESNVIMKHPSRFISKI